MTARRLFNPDPYTVPGVVHLWPGIPDEVMSDDQVAAVVWPGVTGEAVGSSERERVAEVALWRR
jgi:hypothetical protein